jgi:hypothetical protein
MNIQVLQALHQLLGQHLTQQNLTQQRTSGRGDSLTFPISNRTTLPEDASLIDGSQGPVPLTSAVATLMGNPMAQGGQHNPGLIPLQGSRGQRAYPQIGAYGGVQRPGDQFNPQNVRPVY